jgi:uncharacterized protein (TIGR00251 family)
MSLPCLRQVPAGVELSIFVQPRASRNQVVGLHSDELKIKLTAPPVEGAANRECRIFLAKLCNIPKSHVTLISGESSRHKRLLLKGLDVEAVARVVQAEPGA